jgi:cell division protein FtsQ
MAKEPRKSEEKVNWRRWMRAGFWVTACVSTACGAREVKRLVLDDPRFVLPADAAEDERSTEFVVQGVVNTPREQVVRIFGKDFGRNVFLSPLAERRRRLLGIGWVEEAAVARVWPNRIVVRIRERKPVAFVDAARDPQHPQTSRLALIDAEGVILDRPPKGDFSFPLITGVYEQQPEQERRERVRRLVRLTQDIGGYVKNVSEVDVSSADLKITMRVDGRVLLLDIGNRNFERRLKNFLDHYPEIRKRSEDIVAFDLRLDDRVTAKESR